ncbi:MAG: Rrf2 family transcriptional regulator [Thermodesulfobacteriota bacterium]
MRLTTRGQYAVRAVVDLACNGKLKPVTLDSISQREQISIAYLEQLFIKLRRKKLVKSVRGPGGGYLLTRGPEQIKIGEIVEAVEEPLTPVACVDDSYCTRSDRCVTQQVWRELGEKIREFLNSLTVDELVHRCRKIQQKRGGLNDLSGSQCHYTGTSGSAGGDASPV